MAQIHINTLVMSSPAIGGEGNQQADAVDIGRVERQVTAESDASGGKRAPPVDRFAAGEADQRDDDKCQHGSMATQWVTCGGKAGGRGLARRRRRCRNPVRWRPAEGSRWHGESGG